MGVEVVLFTRAGCHLCEAARDVVARVCRGAGVPWREVDVDARAETARAWGDLVPVVTVDGRRVGHWRIDPHDLARAVDTVS